MRQGVHRRVECDVVAVLIGQHRVKLQGRRAVVGLRPRSARQARQHTWIGRRRAVGHVEGHGIIDQHCSRRVHPTSVGPHRRCVHVEDRTAAGLTALVARRS